MTYYFFHPEFSSSGADNMGAIVEGMVGGVLMVVVQLLQWP